MTGWAAHLRLEQRRPLPADLVDVVVNVAGRRVRPDRGATCSSGATQCDAGWPRWESNYVRRCATTVPARVADAPGRGLVARVELKEPLLGRRRLGESFCAFSRVGRLRPALIATGAAAAAAAQSLAVWPARGRADRCRGRRPVRSVSTNLFRTKVRNAESTASYGMSGHMHASPAVICVQDAPPQRASMDATIASFARMLARYEAGPRARSRQCAR
jgi:hypothetical protein